MPIKTFGLTHIALNVKSLKRSLKFYQDVFGMQVMYNQDGILQLQTPGCNDIIVFEAGDSKKGNSGGISHFGFRLQNAGDIDTAVNTITEAGGIILDRGEFIPGEPYVFFKDPDGYEAEVWFELIV
jgi:catechol 2,3-dioxygenase-like lactoylglutathione lyase family enzyme